MSVEDRERQREEEERKSVLTMVSTDAWTKINCTCLLGDEVVMLPYIQPVHNSSWTALADDGRIQRI